MVLLENMFSTLPSREGILSCIYIVSFHSVCKSAKCSLSQFSVLMFIKLSFSLCVRESPSCLRLFAEVSKARVSLARERKSQEVQHGRGSYMFIATHTLILLKRKVDSEGASGSLKALL